MGHSDNGDITSNYIGAYPLEKMLEYNSYLFKVIGLPLRSSKNTKLLTTRFLSTTC